MKFTKDSAIVKVWVMLINKGSKTEAEVPKLFNLQEVVHEVLAG